MYNQFTFLNWQYLISLSLWYSYSPVICAMALIFEFPFDIKIISPTRIQFLNISTAGIPVAISKIIAEYNTLEMYEAKERSYKVGRNIIFISDYERDISIPNDNVVMCSVGVDEEFNKKCHYVFDKSYNGVLKILKKEGMKYE